MADNSNKNVSGWVGWVYFAGFLMILMGIFQMIAGLTALLNNTYYLAHSSGGLLVFNFKTWGWIDLVLGVIVIAAGNAVINGRLWGRLFAILLAMLSIVANFAFISAYPIWSIIVMIVDVFIIFALTVHGDEAGR